MAVIFMSYRRNDSQDVTGRIYDRLAARYSKNQVFKDVDNIPLGVTFPVHIRQVLSKSNVVLVIIGPEWITAKDERGQRRLDDPNDFVRMEVEVALRSNMPVIPVLVSNASMPTANDLPPSMRKLLARNGIAIRPDPDFNVDMGRLFAGIDRLEKIVTAQPARPPKTAHAVAQAPDATLRSAPAPIRASAWTPVAAPAASAAVAVTGSAGKEGGRKASKILAAILAVGVLVAIGIAAFMFARPHLLAESLKGDFDAYRQSAFTGRGSAAYLHRAAPLRYAVWRKRADAGDAIGQLFVGRCYQDGFIVDKDEATGLAWLEKSAARGNDFAMLTLGLAYETGQGVKVERPTALTWYLRGAEAGNTAAMLGVGFLYEGGVAGKPDRELAFTWFRKAADGGHPMAMRFVGQSYLHGLGVAKDVSESERWYQRAAAAGDAHTIGKQFGDRMAPHFAAYLAVNADPAKRSSALAALRDLKRDYDKLDLACVSALFSASEIGVATPGLDDLPGDDPLRTFHDEMTKTLIALYGAASRSERMSYVANFSRATETLLKRWFLNGQNDEVVAFWERSYKDLPVSSLKTGREADPLIRQLHWSIAALMRTGKRKEATEVLPGALELCDRELQAYPWNWYLRDAYTGLCFEIAAVNVELGFPATAQPLLKRGWEIRMKQFGKEDLLGRYPELPLKGNVPPGASAADRAFFERFAGKGTMTRFTIQCDFAGRKYPFHIYVLSGPRGYVELQDQFRWVTEIRGGEVPAKVRDDFLRINQRAVALNADFRELCVEEFGVAINGAKEKKGS